MKYRSTRIATLMWGISISLLLFTIVATAGFYIYLVFSGR